MICRTFTTPDGITGTVCSRRERAKRCRCGREATALCDYKLRGSKSGKTCDAPVCDVHKRSQGTHAAGPHKGDSIDYCVPHHDMARVQPELPLDMEATK